MNQLLRTGHNSTKESYPTNDTVQTSLKNKDVWTSRSNGLWQNIPLLSLMLVVAYSLAEIALSQPELPCMWCALWMLLQISQSDVILICPGNNYPTMIKTHGAVLICPGNNY